MQQLKFHTERLRASGLRPTKQRLALCKILFDRKETFHFTIEKLKQIIERDSKKKISYTPEWTISSDFSINFKNTQLNLNQKTT